MKKIICLTMLLALLFAVPTFAVNKPCPQPETNGPKSCCDKFGLPCEIKKDPIIFLPNPDPVCLGPFPYCG